MKNLLLATGILFMTLFVKAGEKKMFFNASDNHIRYTGRIDFSNSLKPTMWATGTQVSFSFRGRNCMVRITDQVQYGKDHNYLDIVLDGKLRHIKLAHAINEITIGSGLSSGRHDVQISKSSEAGIGYIIFEGIYCKKLIEPAPLPGRKIEFYGDSITSGMGIDTTLVGCHKGEWYDQTNGYLTYAAITARNLGAQAMITSASGIGLVHSCCDMDIVMPQVYDKISIRENKLTWDFQKFQPDLVSICLGQNDGVQDSVLFCNEYVRLLKNLRIKYPNASFVLLSSPMGNEEITKQAHRYLPAIAKAFDDPKLYTYYFSRSWNSGCDYHPSGSEQQLIAAELTEFITQLPNW